MNHLAEISLIMYFLIQLVACVCLAISAEEIHDNLKKDGLTLYHLFVGILLLPAVIVLVLSLLCVVALFIEEKWLNKLKGIKIYKTK